MSNPNHLSNTYRGVIAASMITALATGCSNPMAAPKVTTEVAPTEHETVVANAKDKAVDIAMQLLDNLERSPAPATSQYKNRVASVSNRQLEENSGTDGFVLKAQLPQLGAFYYSETGMLEIFGIQKQPVLSGPNAGEAEVNNVATYFKVEAEAALAKAGTAPSINDFRRAITDKYVSFVGIQAADNQVFNNQTFTASGRAAAIETHNGVFYGDYSLDLTTGLPNAEVSTVVPPGSSPLTPELSVPKAQAVLKITQEVSSAVLNDIANSNTA